MKQSILSLAAIFCAVGSLFAQTINDLTGINTRAKDPVQYAQRFSWVREYHDWSNDIGFRQGNPVADCPQMDEPNEWAMNWNPSRDQSGLRLYYDQYYGALGGSCIPVLKGVAPTMRGVDAYPNCGYKLLEQKPFCLDEPFNSGFGCGMPGLSALPNNQDDPAAYLEHANWMTLFAARFGSLNPTYQGFQNDYVDNYAKLYVNANDPDPNQAEPPDYVNQGHIDYIEDGNEPNVSWEDPKVGITNLNSGQTYWYFTPEQYMAMLSADYDGDVDNSAFDIDIPPGNAARLGVINAAPDINFAMAGLTGLNGQYVLNMAAANTAIRGAGAPLPFNILNFHHYSTDASAGQASMAAFMAGEFSIFDNILIGARGARPEADLLREKLSWLRSGLGTDFQNSEIWLSEFGYDSHPDPQNNFSFNDVPQIDNNSTGEHHDVQKVQAQWLVRSVLEIAASEAIDKAMLYELRDDPGQYGSTFGYSGLRDADYKPKRAWYHVMTLKSVLGGYTFNQDCALNTNAFTIGVPGTRVYEFLGGNNEKIYALWSPTETGEKYDCDLTFNNIQPIDDGATRIEIIEMDESGQQFEQTVSGNTVTDIPVSETVVFVKVGIVEIDPPVLPVSQLQASTQCCEGVRLSWVNQANTLTHRIYYVKKSVMPNWADFSPSVATYFTDAIGPNRTSVVITGLEQDIDYWFFVFPVDQRDNLPPINQATLQVSHTAAVAGSCAPPASCLINVQAGWVSPPSTYNNPDKATVMPQLVATFSADGLPNDCSEMTSTAVGPNPWDFWVDYTSNYATITFPQAYTIDAIYIMDITGNGRLRFEYDDCYCWWQNAGVVQLPANNTVLPNGTTLGNWVSLTNVFPNGHAIKRLKITKLDNVTTVGKILFCGSPASCGNENLVQTPGNLSNLQAQDIRRDGALLTWRAASTNTGDLQAGYVPRYKVQYSQNVDNAGNLVNPATEFVAAHNYEAQIRYRLSNMSPGTTTHVDVYVDYVVNCYGGTATMPPPRRVSFTTPSEGGQERGGPEIPVNDSCRLTLQPNPATSEVQLRLSSGTLQKVQLLSFTGALIGEWPATSDAATLPLGHLPAGILWVRAVRADGSVFTERLVKI